MKAICKNLETPPVFQPVQLIIDIDTAEEHILLQTVFRHNITVPDALFAVGVLKTVDEKEKLAGFLAYFHSTLHRLGST